MKKQIYNGGEIVAESYLNQLKRGSISIEIVGTYRKPEDKEEATREIYLVDGSMVMEVYLSSVYSSMKGYNDAAITLVGPKEKINQLEELIPNPISSGPIEA